ncbi:chromate transporter [Laceyella putida]|uniref:Chromate transporter n=1 Tax=Laceyella putida TaxID=110101 RepID=A0ABW2RJ09_9BACL
MLIDLFVTFFKIGLFSFGGGYAMIPVIEHEVRIHGWMSAQDFSEVIALAGMAPGSLAMNSAVFVGYQAGGVLGAMVALLGMVLPSLLLVVLITAVIFRLHKHPLYKSALYGLKPMIIGLIVYAAIRFADGNLIVSEWNAHTISLLLIFLCALFALVRYKIHPIMVLAMSGMVGVVLYQ